MWLGGHFSLDFDYNLYCYSVGGFKMLKLEIARCSHFHVENEVWIFCGIILVFFFVGFFFFPLLWLTCVFAQESQSWVSSGGCLSSRPCRSTSSCAVKTQQEAFWISLASQYHTIWAHTHTHYIFVQLYSCVAFLHHCPVLLSWYVQVQRFLPHVLLPQRPLHSTALWEHGQPLWGDPRQGGE